MELVLLTLRDSLFADWLILCCFLHVFQCPSVCVCVCVCVIDLNLFLFWFCRVNGEHPQDISAGNRWHVSHSLTERAEIESDMAHSLTETNQKHIYPEINQLSLPLCRPAARCRCALSARHRLMRSLRPADALSPPGTSRWVRSARHRPMRSLRPADAPSPAGTGTAAPARISTPRSAMIICKFMLEKNSVPTPHCRQPPSKFSSTSDPRLILYLIKDLNWLSIGGLCGNGATICRRGESQNKSEKNCSVLPILCSGFVPNFMALCSLVDLIENV